MRNVKGKKIIMARKNIYSKKKRTPLQKAFLVIGIVFCVFAVLLSAAYGVFLHYYGKMNIGEPDDPSVWLKEGELELKEEEIETENSAEEDIQALEEALKKKNESGLDFGDEDVYNLLLLGTDGRSKSERGRSDSMIILSINRRTKKLTLTSLMRDMYMDIPGLSQGNRLNAAYSTGGTERLFATIEQNFDIPLDRFVSVNFFDFVDAIELLGGVDVNVTAKEKEVMRQCIREVCRLKGISPDPYYNHGTGDVTLNGIQALAYARIRHLANGEYDRTGRQREVLTSLFKKVKSQKLSLSEIKQLADTILPCLSTNLTQSEVLGLLSEVPDYMDYELVSARIPFTGTYKNMGVRGMAVIGVDFEENTRQWYDVVYNGAEPQVD